MKKIITILVCVVVLISACKDRDDFMAYSSEKVVKKYFMRGDGDWNIDEMKVWIVDLDHNKIEGEFTRTNVGHVKFKTKEKMDWMYARDTVDVQYATLGSTPDSDWNYLGGSIDWGEYTHGKVVTIDKKNMVLFFPANLNLYTTNKLLLNRSMEFQFKLSKK